MTYRLLKLYCQPQSVQARLQLTDGDHIRESCSLISWIYTIPNIEPNFLSSSYFDRVFSLFLISRSQSFTIRQPQLGGKPTGTKIRRDRIRGRCRHSTGLILVDSRGWDDSPVPPVHVIVQA
jgi:hypothetical protein